MALNLWIIREEYYHVEISCLLISEQAHACSRCLLLSWECLLNRLSLYEITEFKVCWFFQLFTSLSFWWGKNFQVPTWLFPQCHSGSSRCHIVLAQCLSVLRNLGGSVLNQWLFQVYLFENGFLPHSHLIDNLARQKISAEMSFQTCML